MGLFLFVYDDCEEFLKGEDTMRTYVISVKRTKNYIGNHLAEENQYWEYAQYDDMQDLSPLDILALVARHMQKHLIQLRRRESGFMRKVNI